MYCAAQGWRGPPHLVDSESKSLKMYEIDAVILGIHDNYPKRWQLEIMSMSSLRSRIELIKFIIPHFTRLYLRGSTCHGKHLRETLFRCLKHISALSEWECVAIIFISVIVSFHDEGGHFEHQKSPQHAGEPLNILDQPSAD